MNFYPALNKMRKGDFSKFNPTHHYNYMDMEIVITWDYLNDRWTYGSPTHSVSGVFYGSIADLQKQLFVCVTEWKGNTHIYRALKNVEYA